MKEERKIYNMNDKNENIVVNLIWDTFPIDFPLSEGDVIKNYKAMCQLLKESQCTGNARIAQLNRWSRYFHYEKEGNKFRILEVYNEPYPNDDARKYKEGVYLKYIELLLIDLLSSVEMGSDEYKWIVSAPELYRALGMVDKKYSAFQKNKKGLLKILNSDDQYHISPYDIENFYRRSNSKLNSILTSALKSMRGRKIIGDYAKIHIVSSKERPENVLDSDYKGIANNFDGTKHEATEQELQMINEAEKAVLKDMGYTKDDDIRNSFDMETYYLKLDDYVKNEYGWNFYYTAIRIIKSVDIEKQIPVKADEIRELSTEAKRKGLNLEILNAIDLNAEKLKLKNEQALLKYDEEVYGTFGAMKKRPFEYRDNYVHNQKVISKYTIPLTESLLEENKKAE